MQPRQLAIPLGACRSALLTCLVATAMPASGQGNDGSDTKVSIGVLGSYTDNFFYQSRDEQAAFGTLLRPEMQFISETARTRFDLLGRGEYGRFDRPGSNDDYFDRLGRVSLEWAPTYRNRFSADGGLHFGHDPFGIERTEGTASADLDIDEWRQTSLGASYRYGAPGAKINAEIGVAGLDKEYTTNRSLGTQFLDYQSMRIDYRLFYNYSAKTSAIVGFSRTDIDFDRPFDYDNSGDVSAGDVDDRSGAVYQVRGGVRWLATGKTSGDVRVGYRLREFDHVEIDFEGVDWQAGVQWSPSAPLMVEFKTGRAEQESYRANTNIIDLQSHSVLLTRALSHRLKGQFGVEHTQADFVGSGDGRRDETLTTRAGMEYLALSYLFVVGDVSYASRDSNVDSRDFDRFGVFLGLRLGRP